MPTKFGRMAELRLRHMRNLSERAVKPPPLGVGI